MKFKRNQTFKSRPLFNKGKATKRFLKGGLKTGTADKSNIRGFQCNEPGHFTIDCKKPKKKGEAYLKLEAKHEALLTK